MHRSEDGTGSSPNAQSQLLRAYVEREVRSPAIVLVTSARAGDGKSLTAFSLATSLALGGRRTALVTAASPPADAASEGPVLLSVPSAGRGRFREATCEFLTSSRAAYDYTIVDCAPLLSDRLALALLGGVDGVVVTVRVGRPPTDDDESTMRIIERSEGRLLGVVAATPDAIDDFKRRGVGVQQADRTVRRAATSGGVPAMQSLQSLIVAGLLILVLGSIAALDAVRSTSNPVQAVTAVSAGSESPSDRPQASRD